MCSCLKANSSSLYFSQNKSVCRNRTEGSGRLQAMRSLGQRLELVCVCVRARVGVMGCESSPCVCVLMLMFSMHREIVREEHSPFNVMQLWRLRVWSYAWVGLISSPSWFFLLFCFVSCSFDFFWGLFTEHHKCDVWSVAVFQGYLPACLYCSSSCS